MIVENHIHETSAAELYRPIQDQILTVREHWQGKCLADVQAEMPEVQNIELHDDRIMRAVILEPGGERDEEITYGLILPHQQDWTPTTTYGHVSSNRL